MYSKLLSILLVLFLFACAKESPVIDEPELGGCSFDIGEYQLLDGSLEYLPYLQKREVLFSNESGQVTTFSVRIGEKIAIEEKVIDSELSYCYKSEKQDIFLENQDLNVIFNLVVTSKPYEQFISNGYVGDVLEIFYSEYENPNSRSKVFVKTIDQRTYPDPIDPDDFYEVFNIWGRDFYEVGFTSIPDSKSPILFNDEFGIVGFQDDNAIFWRVDELR